MLERPIDDIPELSEDEFADDDIVTLLSKTEMKLDLLKLQVLLIKVISMQFFNQKYYFQV